ncbi:hypothetical protein C2E23DRAFT_726443 [Lenzites betulinus]|nr:hypothetical protein C2E23DRAFT_726443 [Lenzites betulinus]
MSDEPVDIPEPPADIGRVQRSTRGRLPARYRDNIPEGPAPLPPNPPPTLDIPSVSAENTEHNSGGSVNGLKTRTSVNRFGLMREYNGPLPSVDPEDEVGLRELADESAAPEVHSSEQRGLLIAPYPNTSAFLFGRWFWNGAANKSEADRADLLENCILHPEFDPADLRGLNWKKIDRDLASTTTDSNLWGSQDGWKFTSVTIKVPFGNSSPPQDYTVHGLAYRPLEDVIASVFASELSAGYHYTPYQKLWQPPRTSGGCAPPLEKVYGELYTSNAFLDADAELQRSPREPGCDLPRAVVACMPWSDSTHLAEYGNASLWPIYLLFGNQSKYARGRPSSNACHHVAYIPKACIFHDIQGILQTHSMTSQLPSDIDDLIHKHTENQGIDKILTHCRRELMHGIWRVLLSDGFVHACQHGIVVECYDGITRRLYPRFFTYSADYPEKVLLATVRDMGNCPCPRCLVAKDNINAVGTMRDMSTRVQKLRVDSVDRRFKVNTARLFIYEQGKGIGSTVVENLLKPQSLVPTVNAFSERLGPFVPNFHSLFVPDFLHEWELGVWKNLMIHLIRILHAESEVRVRDFNERFRQVPIFGRDTIRRFSGNVSEMKQMAARDFEDALQCFIPVIEALLPQPHNKIVLDVLFDTACLHALHKLRMHTDSTISLVRVFFRIFSNSLRRFSNVTCAAYQTTELPKEAKARLQRQQQRGPQREGGAPATSISVMAAPTATPPGKGAPRRKEFNMNTYKLHSLGDYPDCIVSVGTMDSHSTQIGELAHRIAKRRYARTSKKDFIHQLTNIERRETRLQHISHELTKDNTAPGSPGAAPPHIPLSDHHHIARSQKTYEYLPHFVRIHLTDPAAKDFIQRLKEHLVRRLICAATPDLLLANIAEDQLRFFHFEHDRIYRHQTMRINYTTYDVRRAQDIIHLGTDHCHVMVLSNEDQPEDSHATHFWYAKVIGIYHANVFDGRNGAMLPPKRMEFLHVRWFGRDPEWRSGWAAKRLDRIGFVPESDGGAFEFLDPADVVRGCHLVPAFAEGRTSILLRPSSLSRPPSDNHTDWERYYVNWFVDRDMFMRYLGGAVGHGTLLSPSVMSHCSSATTSNEQDDTGAITLF